MAVILQLGLQQVGVQAVGGEVVGGDHGQRVDAARQHDVVAPQTGLAHVEEVSGRSPVHVSV